MNAFSREVLQHAGEELTALQPQTVQVNVGLRCNLSCRHCHVGGSPNRPEVMSWPSMESVLRLLEALPGSQVDITGGAPELNPNFRRFVQLVRLAGHAVQVRTNLTVLSVPGMEDLPEFFHDHDVRLVASLPCYLDRNVDQQRGTGVYQKSVDALRRLNRLGYGVEGGHQLNLVYNPGGAFLPPGQSVLEADYRRYLSDTFGIQFSQLLTITNMPIGRFLDELRRDGREAEYRGLLRTSFNPATIEGLMCRHQICVGWDGSLSDCDFNQVLGIGIEAPLGQHVDHIDPRQLAGRKILTGDHCFGCTAGSGSSCAGALVA